MGTEEQLDNLLSEPTAGVIETLGRLPGDLVVLGVSGKMGPTLARMAQRASEAAGVKRKVIGVARFSSGGQEELEAHGIETIRCDLLSDEEVVRLPEVPNVVFMVGMKFGTRGNQSKTWVVNSYLPGVVCRKYRKSRILAFSTGNVYGLTPVASGGSREEDDVQPVGEYAMSCVGRERVFEYFSRAFGIPMTLVRLNYACELRYGALVDIARKVWTGETIDLSMGHFNVIWQGDANALALRGFDVVTIPPRFMNLTGPEVLSVRVVAERLGELMNREVHFAGQESAKAFLSDARRTLELFGLPRFPAGRLLEWAADWVARGGKSLGKPTRFESRDGMY